MSKFEQISTFINVVEENGFAAAARKNGVSTAAISRQIALLEAELNVELLTRTTRRVSLTEIGEVYYQQCKKALYELQAAESVINASKEEASGVLNIMANRYFAITHLLPKLSEFISLNPNLKINFQLGEKFPNFDDEKIDILFGVSVEGADNLIRKRIATTRYILCASPHYFKQYGKPDVPADLIKHKYITHSIRQPDDVIFFKDGKDIRVNPMLWLNDSYAMRECAIAGMGIVNLHDYMVNDAIKDGKLIEVLQVYQEPNTNVYLYYQQNRYLQPKIRRFIDFYTD